jgi:hypothetical protein
MPVDITKTPAPSPVILAALRTLRDGLADFARDIDDTFTYDPTDALALSRYLAHDFPRELRRAEEAIADALPALTPADFLKACNGDHAIEGEVTRWRDGRWSMVDVTDLAREEERSGDETWTILRGSSRFEVREVPRYEARHSTTPGSGFWYVHDHESNDEASPSDERVREALDTPADEETPDSFTVRQASELAGWLNDHDGETCYIVVDTEDGGKDARDLRDFDTDFDSYDVTDESEADDAAAEGNREDYRTNAAGWPFAHNYAAAIDERDADDFAACGFVVATHEPSGQVYAGIDGGGYSFLDAHWAPLYLRMMLTHGRAGSGAWLPEKHIYVPTRDGLRRVVRAAE